MTIHTTDRVFVVGTTGAGKTTLARRLFESMPPPRLLVDPKAEVSTAYAVTFSDPTRIPEGPVARFVPADPSDLDIYDRLYKGLFVAGPRSVWLDEARIAAPATRCPDGITTLITQGRSRGIGHIAATQRPVHVARELISESEHLIVFRTGHPADLDVVAGIAGMAPREFATQLARCPRYGFVWYDARASRLTIVVGKVSL